MRPQRLLVLGGLIAAALVWLFLVLPRPGLAPRAQAPKPASSSPASLPAPVAPPPRRALARPEPAASTEPPPDLPPTVPVAPLAVPAAEASPRPAPGPIEAERAADLFAELLAAQDEAEDGAGDSQAALWKRFSREAVDADWASALTPVVDAAMREWIDTLPESVRDHVAVVHVECRATLCQILVADNDLASQEMRAALGQDGSHAGDGLIGKAWWDGSGLAGKAQQTTRLDGHALTVTYLLRAADASTH